MKRIVILLGFSLIIAPAVLLAQDFKRVTDTPIGSQVRMSQGVSMVDYNNDGNLDIYVGNGTDQHDFLFLGDGEGHFDHQSNNPIVNANTRSNGPTWADYNNDGHLDLYVANAVYQKNGFFRNTGDGFVQVTHSSLTGDASSSLGASWGDYNNDGFVDLFVANGYYDLRNKLYKNNGDGTFTAVEDQVITEEKYYTWQGNWIDIEDDGDLDLYVLNAHKRDNSLYINENGTFEERMEGPLVNDGAGSNGASWGDYDNDGDMDVFVTNGSMKDLLYENDGTGGFNKVKNSPVVADSSLTSGSCWSDFNNDGYLDLFVVAGMDGHPKPNYLFMNRGDGTFKKINSSVVLEKDTPANGVSAACGDYNNDGFVDLLVGNWEEFANNLYLNEGNENNWLVARLQGTQSNRSAIGAEVRALATIDGEKVWQTRTVQGNGGHRSQNSLELEFGLANAGKVDSLVIQWPSGIKQVRTEVEANQYLRIVEDSVITNFNVEVGKKGGVPGDTALVPITVEMPEDSSIVSFEFTFTIDPDLEFAGLDTSSSLLAETDWITSSHRTDSTLRISAAGSKEIRGNGRLMALQLMIPETAAGRYDVHLGQALFNTSVHPDHIKQGGIIIPSYGDVDLNQKVQAFDASVILQYLLENRSLTEVQRHYAEVSQDGSISALDASLVLQYTTGAVIDLPVTTDDSGYVAEASINMLDVEAHDNNIVSIPVKFRNGENIYSVGGELTYDASDLTFKGLVNSEGQTMGVQTSAREGRVLFVGATATPLQGDGTLVKARFALNENNGKDDYQVRLENLRLNENVTIQDAASSMILTDIGDRNETDQPKRVHLKQNYPNPFNPSTTIEYILPEKTSISLRLYNINGRLIRTLASGIKAPGTHRVRLNAENLSSGIYYYRLKTESGIVKSRKTTLIK